MYLIFDTETTGLPKNYNAPYSDLDNWPRCVQIAWQLHDKDGRLMSAKNYIIKPEGYDIPFNAVQIHGITTEKALNEGHDLATILSEFEEVLQQSVYVAGHNIGFDVNIMGAEYLRKELECCLHNKLVIDTKDESTEYCALPGGKGGKFKWPNLGELHEKLFNHGFGEAHNAAADVEATARCFFELCRLKVIDREDIVITDATMKHLKEVAQTILATVQVKESMVGTAKDIPNLTFTKKTPPKASGASFVHLHCHSQYSVLQSTSDVASLVAEAGKYNMPGVALTDHANMYGAFHFWQAVEKENAKIREYNEKVEAGEEVGEVKNEVKCIIGCELNVCEDHTNKSRQDNGAQQVLIAINETGYHNLCRISSVGFVDGFYYVPRVSKPVIEQNKEGLIATTGSIYGEIPNLILNVGEKQAEEAFLWWKETFGENFYAELNRHGLPEEDHVNAVLLKFCKKHGVKYFAANNNYYVKKEQSKAHDILLCIKDNEKVNTPIGKGRGYRYGLPNDRFYFTSPEEMAVLFSDLPEALEQTVLIAEQVEPFKLGREVLLPKYEIPEEFEDEDAFLRHLTYEGAKKRYGEITPELTERLDFELATIKNSGYPGYFLIVQDFTTKAREMGVSVGPGRGSAAGSAVAYCIGITNVDPIKYDLLFERFLNPERVSMPDIDIDFDDRGRAKVMRYVIDKYGKDQVAQIITYGTLGGRSALKDAARVLDYPLQDANMLSNSFPATPGFNLHKVLYGNKEYIETLNGNVREQVLKFRELLQKEGSQSDVIKVAYELEGSVRNTGIHACGVIITPDKLTNYVPVATSKDADLLCTQFDNSVAESAGLLKMDFLGLKTLTIISDAIEEIKRNHNVTLVADDFPLEDTLTYELFQRGETNGIFQFESLGMQKNLKELKPDKFEDLIAMNALYRPGPMEYIPNYIARKHGIEQVAYDLPVMEEYLAETYGITVYQEQVMRLSQKLANFTKGEADTLRKAMGKKQKAVLNKMKSRFIEGATGNGHPEEKLEKIWTDWEAFAQYAFNKSHSTCYAVLAFQTAYLKAHYPHEFMASVLNHTNSIESISFYIAECRRMGIEVLGPSVNESQMVFAVSDKQIRFGLASIKGVGEGAAQEIIEVREKDGTYKSLFDLTKRVNLKSVNKRVMEALAVSGGLDCFAGIHRAQYFYKAPGDDYNVIEKAVKFGAAFQAAESASQQSLFGGESEIVLPEPQIINCDPWKIEEALEREKELVGMYLSGHPLEKYTLEINELCSYQLKDLANLEELEGKNMVVAGLVTKFEEREGRNGNLNCNCIIEDFNGRYEFRLFARDYNKFRQILNLEKYIYLKGIVQKREWPPESTTLEFKINHIGAIREMKQDMLKSMELVLSLDMVNQDLTLAMNQMLGRKKGDISLKLRVMEKREDKIVQLPLRSTQRIGVDQELLDFLNKQKVGYKLELM